MSSEDGSGLTRRNLLKTGAAAAGAAALGGCLDSAPGLASTDRSATPVADADTAFGNCWMCCHNCAQEVKVNDDTVVGITGVDGNPRGSAGPGTNGTLCPKGLAQLDKTHDPDRIKQPYIREDGELREATWDEAFEYTAERLQEFDEEHGAETFLDAGSWAETPIFRTIWRDLYGTPERIGRGVHVCAGPTFVTGGMMGVGLNNRVPDYQNSEYLIMWGRNPLGSFAGQFEAKGVLEAIEKNDATPVTIDPQYTETAEKSDEWLPIEPRTDGALALAIAHVIIQEGRLDLEFVQEHTHGFEAYRESVADKTPEWAAEITGIDADKIREIARGFAEAAPAAGISVWTGTAQMGNGWKATQNITALNGLAGNIDRPGGLRLWKSTPTADPFEVCEWTPDEKGTQATIGVDLPNNAAGKEPALHKYEEYEEYPFRHIEGIAHNLVPEMVENDHINGIYCHHDMPLKDGNAEAWLDALDEMDLVIAVDAYWNGVTRNADVVFADATQLEKDTVGTGSWSAYPEHQWVVGGKAAVEPQFNTKPDWEILTGIAEAMGWGENFPWDDHEEFIDDQLQAVDLTLEELDSGDKNYELVGEYGYEQWRDEDGPAFSFDLDQIPPFVQAAEEAGMDTAPEWQPPGTYGDELDEEYPLEFYDIRSVFFSHGSDQGIDRCLDQFARKNELEDEDYRGNYLHLNPEDAEERGIETGDMVTVESETGGGELMAHVTETIKPGIVTAEYGFGEGSAQEDYEGMNTMKLHAKQMDPITGQPDRHIAVDVTSGGE
ncbi:molybdopterin-dependent oxidoreductase [Natronoarchaeum sp. GCM10025321]|uniref:molybdopterin-containing oxidoreductase family protein n=1 Tax=Natronoarchaeum sp. GCM10025321 TaxID=3252684 RepID=UPI003620FE58